MGVCGNVCCVADVVKNSVFLSLGVLKYVVRLCRSSGSSIMAKVSDVTCCVYGLRLPVGY